MAKVFIERNDDGEMKVYCDDPSIQVFSGNSSVGVGQWNVQKIDAEPIEKMNESTDGLRLSDVMELVMMLSETETGCPKVGWVTLSANGEGRLSDIEDCGTNVRCEAFFEIPPDGPSSWNEVEFPQNVPVRLPVGNICGVASNFELMKHGDCQGCGVSFIMEVWGDSYPQLANGIRKGYINSFKIEVEC